MTKRIYGAGGVWGAVFAATLGTAVGCGDSFAGGDCHASRTCEAEGGGKSLGGTSPDATDGGAATSSNTGGDETALGGATPVAAAAGAAGVAGADSECQTSDECSNSDPTDGEEVCENGACASGNPPPAILSVTPKDEAVDVEQGTSVVIQFSEPIDDKTAILDNIRVLDGTEVVGGTLTLNDDDDKVTFRPTSELALLAPYTVSVGTGVKDKQGAKLVEELTSTFSIRDGAWHEAITVAEGDRITLSDVLPMDADGRVLMVWAGSTDLRCPAWARWFLRGDASAGGAKALALGEETECYAVSAAGNAGGVLAVSWSEPSPGFGLEVAQYRAGAWQASPALVSDNISSFAQRAVVLPNGTITLFEHSSSISKVWTTDVGGAWSATGDVLSAFSADGGTSVGFDAKGNGLAVWRARDPSNTKPERIVASRLSDATGKWQPVVDLPGSVLAKASTATKRGVPVVAVADEGDAMALWIDASSSGKLVASRYQPSTGWAAPTAISGTPVVNVLHEPPALVFDGKDFVAAWTAGTVAQRYTYTARYDATTGWGLPEKQQTTVADGTSAGRMPRLVSDRRGNLLLVLVNGTGSTFTLLSQRYTNGAWSVLTPVPGGTITHANFEDRDILPLSVSKSGLAALAWTNYDGTVHTVRFASFY